MGLVTTVVKKREKRKLHITPYVLYVKKTAGSASLLVGRACPLNQFIDTQDENKLVMIVFFGRHYYTVLYIVLKSEHHLVHFFFFHFYKRMGVCGRVGVHYSQCNIYIYVFTVIVKR